MDAFLPGVDGWEAIYNGDLLHFRFNGPRPRRWSRVASARTSNTSGTTSPPTGRRQYPRPIGRRIQRRTLVPAACVPRGRTLCRFRRPLATSRNSPRPSSRCRYSPWAARRPTDRRSRRKRSWSRRMWKRWFYLYRTLGDGRTTAGDDGRLDAFSWRTCFASRPSRASPQQRVFIVLDRRRSLLWLTMLT